MLQHILNRKRGFTHSCFVENIHCWDLQNFFINSLCHLKSAQSATDLCTYCKKFLESVKENNFIEIQGKAHQSSHEEHSVISTAKIIKAASKEHIFHCVHICISNKRCFSKMERIIHIKSMHSFSFSIKPKSWFISPASLLLKMCFFSLSSLSFLCKRWE